MKTKNIFYIAGYLNGKQIGVVDSDGKFNNREQLDFDSWKHFGSEKEAQIFVDNLLKNETKPLHPDFLYRVEEWDADYYSDENKKLLEFLKSNNINYKMSKEGLEIGGNLDLEYTKIKSLPTKKYEIDFGGNVLAGIEITNDKPTVIGAMNGWGNGISKDDITITEK